MEILSSKDFNTPEEIQEFIDNNPTEIRTARDLIKKQPKLYGKLGRNHWARLMKYPDPPLNNPLKDFQTFDDFQRLANNYDRPADFVKNHKTISDKFFTLRSRGVFSGDLYFPKRKFSYDGKFTEVSEFQAYIDENSIESPKKFQRFNSALYKRLTALGFAEKVKYKHRAPKPRDYSEYKNRGIEGIQNFVIKYNINSNVDFNKRASTLFRLYLKIRKETGQQVIFSTSGMVCSEEEWLALLDLLRYNIKFISQYDIKGYPYKYDFYLPEYNIILEIHGGQHFDKNSFPEDWRVNGDSVRERDILKNQIANDNNIKIYYISYCAYRDYERFGYFEQVYKSIKELFETLNIPTIDDGKLSDRLLNLYPKNIIESINKILIRFRIYSLEDLNNLPQLRRLIIESNILDKLTFYNDFYENYNEDVND